ncbi:MAG: double zinc ribbon domain-containing protein [Methyloceanibacter sp.]
MGLMPISETEPSRAQPAPRAGTWASLRNAATRAANLLLTPVRISCRTHIESDGLPCGACFDKIDFIAPPLCTRLGVPLPYDAGERCLSAAAIAEPPVYDRARAVARYSETMRN